jgi:hypothetical protein
MQRVVIANLNSSDASADDGRSGCDTNDYAEMVLITEFPVRPFPCLEEGRRISSRRTRRYFYAMQPGGTC